MISAFLVVSDLWIFNFGIMGLLKRCHLLPVSGDWRGKGKVSHEDVMRCLVLLTFHVGHCEYQEEVYIHMCICIYIYIHIANVL